MPQSTKPTLLTARIIAGSFITGVVIFWVIAWVLGSAGAGATEAARPVAKLQFWIWGAAELAGLAGALVLRGRVLQLVEGQRSGSGPPSDERLARVQVNLIVAWALLELPALLAGAFIYLLGTRQILWAAVPWFVVGMALTFPRAEWFGGARS